MAAANPAVPGSAALTAAAQRIDALLPQTQCTRCGEPDCARYAQAIADGAPINRCPPGGAEGIARLAALTNRPIQPLDPVHGQEGPRNRVWIDEAACIGCTLCIKACPVDAIVGAAKRMHHVLDDACTGCDLCLPACPVDCIHTTPATPGRSGWAAWSLEQATEARSRYHRRQHRLARDAEHAALKLAARSLNAPSPTLSAAPSNPLPQSMPVPADDGDRKRAAIEAAIARARARHTA